MLLTQLILKNYVILHFLKWLNYKFLENTRTDEMAKRT